MRAALAENNVAGHNQLCVALLGSKAFSGPLRCAIGNTLRGVRGVSELEAEGKDRRLLGVGDAEAGKGAEKGG